MYDYNNNGKCTIYIWYYDALCAHSWVVLLKKKKYQLQVTKYKIYCHAFSRFNLFGAEKVREVQWRHFLLDLSFLWWCKFKGLRLVMWSLLHDTDQLREMLSTDQSLRDRRSRGLWSVLSLSRGWSVACNSWPNHQSQTRFIIIICFHKIGPNCCVILQVYIMNWFNVTLNKALNMLYIYLNKGIFYRFSLSQFHEWNISFINFGMNWCSK